MTKILTKNLYLYNFPGFYESGLSYFDYFEGQFDYEEDKVLIDCLLDEDLVDYKEYQNDLGKYFLEYYYDAFKEKLNNAGFYNFKFIGIDSPKEYNYGNDNLEFSVDIDIKKLKKFIEEEKEGISEYIKKKNTSYDGYIPYLSNNFSKFKEELLVEQKDTAFSEIIDYIIQMGVEEDSDINLGLYCDVELYYGDYIKDMDKLKECIDKR